MQYKASKNSKLTYFILWLCLLCTAVTLILPASLEYYKWTAQLACLVFAICDVQIAVRYILSDYLYFLDGNILKIYKITGKKSVCVLSVSLSDIKGSLYNKEEYKEKKVHMKLNYCKNMFAKERKYLLFTFNETECSLCFEPSEEFCKLLLEALCADIKENKDE